MTDTSTVPVTVTVPSRGVPVHWVCCAVPSTTLCGDVRQGGELASWEAVVDCVVCADIADGAGVNEDGWVPPHTRCLIGRDDWCH